MSSSGITWTMSATIFSLWWYVCLEHYMDPLSRNMFRKPMIILFGPNVYWNKFLIPYYWNTLFTVPAFRNYIISLDSGENNLFKYLGNWIIFNYYFDKVWNKDVVPNADLHDSFRNFKKSLYWPFQFDLFLCRTLVTNWFKVTSKCTCKLFMKNVPTMHTEECLKSH